jgi:beta-lactamase regulating signal transducer with metallopeptidase domain
MILPYLLRLLCLCFASFFVLNAAVGVLVRLSSKSAIRFAPSRTSSTAARLLLAFRLLPLAIAVLFVAVLCVPSYLWLEPAATAERVGLVCLLLGVLGAAICFLSMARAVGSLVASVRHNRLCRLGGQKTRLLGNSSPIVLFEDEAPLLALSGLLRPQLLISRGVLRVLSAEELDAALRHEHAHHASRDNAKRLLLLLAPDIFPFVRAHRTLEHSWSKFAEWAADDQAAGGDSQRALSLAAALVQVARMGSVPRLPVLTTSLLAGDKDLAARVDRLLCAEPMVVPRTSKAQSRFSSAAFLLVVCLVAMLLAPSALSSVHELLELLLH